MGHDRAGGVGVRQNGLGPRLTTISFEMFSHCNWLCRIMQFKRCYSVEKEYERDGGSLDYWIRYHFIRKHIDLKTIYQIKAMTKTIKSWANNLDGMNVDLGFTIWDNDGIPPVPPGFHWDSDGLPNGTRSSNGIPMG